MRVDLSHAKRAVCWLALSWFVTTGAVGGVLYKDKCYATLNEQRAAFCSDQYYFLQNTDGTVFVMRCAGTDYTAQMPTLLQRQVVSQVQTTSLGLWPGQYACDEHTYGVGYQVLNLSLEDATKLSAAILMLWALGWGARVAIRTLRDTDEEQKAESES